MILLDTDILTLLLLEHARVVARQQECDEEVGTTIISRIEVLQGRFEAVLKAANAVQLETAQQRLTQTELALMQIEVFPVTSEAAQVFDRFRQIKSIKKIGRADLLIAAIALANRATLITRNLKHFRQVPNLRVENWAD